MRYRLPIFAATAAVVLTGCGTTQAADSGEQEQTSSAPVTVTDSRGEVELDAPAEDVVALEWAEAEDLVTLGVMPVGVADVKGYQTWVGSGAPLDGDVADVGTRQEPSVDSIVKLDPDLVVMEADRGSALVEQIEEYLPVVTITGSDAGRNIEQMRSNLELIATATGTEDKAEEVLADFDQKLADGRAALEQAGVAGDRFAMADGWKEGSTISIRMFGKGSLMSDLAEELGLENAYTGEVDEVWGLGQTDVEGLTKIGDAHFFYSASEDDVFAGGLAQNAIWKALPFVENNKVHKLEPGTWTFGGPASSGHFVDQVVKALTS